jgi:hypothetical protein
VRELCEGKPHARFDEGELEKQVTAVCLFPTLHVMSILEMLGELDASVGAGDSEE